MAKSKFFDGPLDGLEAEVPPEHDCWRFTHHAPQPPSTVPPIGAVASLWPRPKRDQPIYIYARDFKGDMIYQGLDHENEPEGK